MFELKPFKKGRDDPEEWLEKFSRILENNPAAEDLLFGPAAGITGVFVVSQDTTTDGKITVKNGVVTAVVEAVT